MTRWARERSGGRGAGYDRRWEEMAARGEAVHGEVDHVLGHEPPPTSVLDAGCGTGRVAIELARRGIDVVGVDLDPAMLDQAREKAPELLWVLSDLAALDLDAQFDAVVAAGNVMIFLEPGTESRVVQSLASHLAPGGRLIAGFQLGQAVEIDDYDHWADQAGLRREDRFATWEGDPWTAASNYVVAVHRRG